MAYCWIHVLKGSNDLISSHLADVKKSLMTIQDSEDVLRPLRLAVIPSLVETIEATIALDRKQANKAKEHAQKAISLIPDSPDPTIRGLLHGAASYRLAMANRELGEYDQACNVLIGGLEMLKASANYFGVAAIILQLVTIYRSLDKTQEATILCEETLDFVAEHHWQDMAPSGVIHVILASIQMDAGDHTSAKKNLELGRRQADQLSSQHIVDLVASTEKQINGNRTQSQHLIDLLSPRELEVLDKIASGHTNREICEELFLALDTVKGHNRNIYRKLGVKSRIQAVNKAISLKIISIN